MKNKKSFGNGELSREEIYKTYFDKDLLDQKPEHKNGKVENSPSELRFIDLFAGIGGIRLAFESYGKCVFSSEWDKNSQLTYIANFGERPHGDIRPFLEKDIPAHNILLAGFPCQAFSVAGYRKGFKDIRGTLFFDIERILEYHKPEAFLLENVKGLVNHNGGNSKLTSKDC